jgi:hypothetical protein
MNKLRKEVKSIAYKFTKEELAELSERNAKLNVQIEEKKGEAKSVATQFQSEVKSLESQRVNLSNKIISKTEMREVFCYIRKNFETSQIEFISVEGELVSVEPFKPSDYSKQLELKEEVATEKLKKVKYFGMKHLFDQFQEVTTDSMSSNESEVMQALNDSRIKFVSRTLKFLFEDSKLINADDEVEFDVMYDIVDGWYNEFADRYYIEPTQDEFPIPEEKEKIKDVEQTTDTDVNYDLPSDQEEKPNAKSKKGKKKDDSEESQEWFEQ